MTLGSWSALVLTIVAVAVYWIVPVRARNPVLVIASYIFYIASVPAHALLLAALTLGTFAVGRRIRRRPDAAARTLTAAGIGALLAVLATFKYAGFLVQIKNAAWSWLGLGLQIPVPAWVAPLGISFVTFGLVHFLIEMRKGDAPEPTLIEFAAYVSFYPTVVSGPIKRYPEFVADGRAGVRRPRSEDVTYGIWRILLGVFRKFVVADTIGVLAAPLLAVETTTPMIVVAVYAYAFKIYFDFAGYSDIAIGTARLFGYEIMENFDGPYLRRNLSEFWRCWHASLTRFITEYIYIPLGGNRRGTARAVLNTLVAMALSGLWHGAAAHFVVWGLWHGAGLAILRLWKQVVAALRVRSDRLDRLARSRAGSATAYAAGWFITFNYVVLGWVLFVLGVKDSLAVYRSLVGFALEAAHRVVGIVL